jgi:serine/threonine-protein kinase
MAIILTVISGAHVGRSFRFDRHDTFLVGRAAEAHFSLPDDPYFSRMHFLVEANPPQCRLTDLGSRNGTLVNGQKVQSIDLKHGDEIMGGQMVLKVALTTDRAGQTLDLPCDEAATPLPATDEHCIADSPPNQPVGPLTPIQRVETARSDSPNIPRVPGYAVMAELGRGGMGAVYRARRESDGLEVAIKTIRPGGTGDSHAITRFQREVRILEQLRHPNIVAFHESGVAGHLLYFVMELVLGRNAGHLVRVEGPLDVRRAVRLAMGVLSGLEYAHCRGFVHRDIKPANLLVLNTSQGEEVKLADFGLARVYQESPLSGLTLSGIAGGTPSFMPPEQITDFHSVRPAADQYSAAATLYYLVTGRHTYDGDTPSELFRKKLTEDPIPLESRRHDLPRELATAIHRALARRPNERFSNVAAFGQALRPFA